MKFNKMIALSVLVAGMSSALIAGPGEAAVRGAMKEVPDGTVSALAERFNSGDVAKKAKKVAKKVGALPRHLKLGSTEYYKHLHRTLPEHARLRVGRTAKVATGAAVDAFEAAKAKFGPAVEHAKKTAKIIIKQKPGESVEAFIKRMEAALEGREDDYEDVAEELAKAKDINWHMSLKKGQKSLRKRPMILETL